MARIPPARAYYNQGLWIADCPRPGCTNAQALMPNQWQWICGQLYPADQPHWRSPGSCGLVADIEWPRNAAEITAELDKRPVVGTRNWFPKDHDLALRANCEHGQTVAELAEEFHAMDPVSAKVANMRGTA